MWGQGATLRLGETPPGHRSNPAQAPATTLYYTHIIQIACKYCTNILQISYKYQTSTRQINSVYLGEAPPGQQSSLAKPRHSRVSAPIVGSLHANLHSQNPI